MNAAAQASGTVALRPNLPGAKKRRRVSPLKMLPVLFTVGPMILWLLIFVLCPLIYIFIISFLKRSTYGGLDYIFNLDNYGKLFSPLYLEIFGISILIAAATTVFCFLIGYPFAYIIGRSTSKHKNAMVLLMMLPFWTNSLIRTYGWITLLRNEGVFNTLLQAAHMTSHPLQLLYTTGSVMLGMVYTLFPYMVLPLYSSLEKLDGTLLEASSDLGAGPVRSFLRVTLPLTGPGIFAGAIQVFVPTLGYFFISDLMGGGKTMLVGNLIENQFTSAQNWPFGAALSIILIALTLLLLQVYKWCGGSVEDMA
jgi:ABC-type spermidine/putrescine transport system, permease component I